jgi:TIR domain
VAVFISYARSDRLVVDVLRRHIELSQREVWLDERLTGGQAWWDSILSHVRSCEVFIYALSPDSLNSRACRAEFDYAQALARPILPVMVRDAPVQLAPPRIANTQIVDYRNPTAEGAMSLRNALEEMPRPPSLPDPLPDEPPVPMSYLDQYRALIDGEDLDYTQQTVLLARLRPRLSDEDDRPVVIDLLRKLEQRPDAARQVAEEIHAILADLPLPRRAGRRDQEPQAREDQEDLAPPQARRRRLGPLVGAVTGVLVLIVLAGAFLLSRGGEVSPNRVVQINPMTLDILESVPIPGGSDFGAKDIAIGRQGAVWVLGRSEVARIDPNNPALRELIALHSGGVDLGAGTGGVWVIYDDAVSRIDPYPPKSELGPRIPLDEGPSSLAVGDWVWILGTGQLQRIDPDQVDSPETIRLNGDRLSQSVDGVWVANTRARSVRRIDPSDLSTDPPISLDAPPDGIASTEGQVWVFNTSNGTVTRIDPNSGTADEPIPVGGSPVAIRIGLDAVWTANGKDGTISRIDLASGTRETIDLDATVVALGLDQKNETLWGVVTE